MDAANLRTTFQDLGFKLYKDKVHLNLTSQKMKKLIGKFASDECHNQVSCSAVIIMAHGEQGGKLISYDESPLYINRDVLPCFSNDSAIPLRGKLKMFFFQACRQLI